MQPAPRTPVLIGVGQVTDRPTSPARYDQRPHPLDLMVQALERASDDTGVGRRSLESINELIAVGSFTWHTTNPALLVAERLGLVDVVTRLTPTGGNIPQALVHQSAQRILAGEIETVAVVGSEAMYAHALARREGRKVDWQRQGDSVAAPELVEEDRIPFTAAEYEQGLTLPVEVYPIFENARRARLGWTLDEQRRRLGQLWANFAAVAATNPYAWISDSPSAETISTPSAQNRMVAFPYTKMLVANLPVDMGAAYLLTSFERATSLGVARERMVFPQCGADAVDPWYISQRPKFDDSIAMRALWSSLEGFGASLDTLEHLDLYSCFPTVVQSACDVLGIDAYDPTRVPTMTGGLTFAGGPGNNYVTHAIAATVEALRTNADHHALVTGLGWFSTKHSWGTYAATPPTQGFQWRSAQSDVDAAPQCVFEQRDGLVTIESYTVVHHRDGHPLRLVCAARTSDAVRLWCHSYDVELMALAETDEIIGRTAEVREGVIYL